MKIFFEKKESINEMQNQIGKEHIIFCDEIQNTFLIVSFDNVNIFGIAYFDYGIKPDYLYSISHNFFYLGFGMKFIGISVDEKKVMINDNLKSVFYEILFDSNMEFICVICEINVYCYRNEEQIWEMGLSDIIIDYKMINEKQIIITCADSREYTVILHNGKLV